MKTERELYFDLVNKKPMERLINGYRPFDFVISDPLIGKYYLGCYIEGQDTIDPFGVTIRWKKGEHAGMPFITENNKAVPDICEWKDYWKEQDIKYPDEAWAQAKADLAKIDRKEKLATGLMVSGVFEKCHALMGFEDTLMNFLLEPDDMHDLIDKIFEWKMEYAKELLDHLELDAILYHDDLGAKDKLFFSVDIFREFFKEGYEKLFSYIRSRGCQVILHADSYCEPLVEDFVDCHVNVWQGALCTNNFEAIQARVKGDLILMGAVDSIVDRADWTKEEVEAETLRAIKQGEAYGGFIPCITYGLRESIFPGVIEAIEDVVEAYNKEHYPDAYK